MYSFENITNSIHSGLVRTLSPTVALLCEFAIVGLCAITLFALLGLVLVLMERKVSAYMQIRRGAQSGGTGRNVPNGCGYLKTGCKRRVNPRWCR